MCSKDSSCHNIPYLKHSSGFLNPIKLKPEVLSKTHETLSDLSQVPCWSPLYHPLSSSLGFWLQRHFPLYLNRKSLFLAQGLCPIWLPWLYYPSLDLHGLPSQDLHFSSVFPSQRGFIWPNRPAICHSLYFIVHLIFQSIILVWNHLVHLFICVYYLSPLTWPRYFMRAGTLGLLVIATISDRT